MTDDVRRRASGYALVAISACSWGTWPLILRRAPMPAALQSTLVMIVMTLAVVPFMVKDRVRRRAPLGAWLGVAWLGVGDAMNVGLFFAAYQRTTVAVAVLTHCMTPLFVALSAPLLLREPSRPRTYVAVLVSFVGLGLLLEPWRASLGAGDLVGAALGAGSAVFYASNVIVNKRLAPWFSASELMFFHGFVAVPLLAMAVSPAELARLEPGPTLVVLAGAVGPGALAGLMFVWGLRRVPASHASVLTMLEPFVAVLLATAFLGETLGVVPIAGGLAILAGAVTVVAGTDSNGETVRLASARAERKVDSAS